MKMFRVRKNTGKYVDKKVYSWPSGEERIVRRWQGDVYTRPVADIPIKILEEVDIEIPKVD